MATTQKIRDMLRPGDQVSVLVHITSTITKKRPAKVLQVLRAAARLKMLDDSTERTVPFGELDFEGLTPPVEKKRLSVPLAQVLPLPTPIPAPAKAVEPPPAPAPAPAPTPAKAPVNSTAEALREFSAIVEMASSVEAQLQVAQAELLQRARALNAEKAEIEREIETLANEQRELDTKLAILKTLRK